VVLGGGVTGAGPANYFGAINRKSIEANDKKHFTWVWKTEKTLFCVLYAFVDIDKSRYDFLQKKGAHVRVL
jgi:hypothetical protein